MKLIHVCLVLFAVASISSIAYAQHRVGSTDEDLGIDTAVVIAVRANLREHPTASSLVLRELGRGDMLALLNRDPVGPWYRVIHIRSSTEGWINGNTIRLKYTESPKGGPVFEERSAGTNEDPSIQVTNDSNSTLYLKVGDDDRIVIPPHGTRGMTKLPGRYSFYASSPGVIPRFGEHEFRSGIIYEWTFYIVTTLK